MDLRTTHINYIQTTLVANILSDDRFAGQVLQSCVVSKSAAKLDGFMSAVYQVDLTVLNENDESTTCHKLVVKLMKGDDNYRFASRSYVQFANEIYMYTQVLPQFEKLLRSSQSPLSLEDVTPRVFYGFFGQVAELSTLRESVLALQDLRPSGFRSGPRLVLDEHHLRLMLRQIAQFHAISYALKIQEPTQFEELVSGIIPMPFQPSGKNGDTANQYTVLYTIAVNRFLAYTRRTSDRRSAKFLRDADNLERRYGKNPVVLLDHMRRTDNEFSVIQHGDYNRNNVLFKYEENLNGNISEPTFDNVTDIRMLDFQEARFGSPVFDLSFFLYMNSDPKTRPLLWNGLLEYYHEVLIGSLSGILGCSLSDDRLKPYSFERFKEHFSQFALYGIMVVLHFTPWMICSDEDCRRLDRLFTEDMHSKECYDFSMVIGGDEADERMAEVIEHASQNGYLDCLQ